jgi:hypothetical protein
MDRLEVAIRMSDAGCRVASQPTHAESVADIDVQRVQKAGERAFDAQQTSCLFRPMHARLWRTALLELNKKPPESLVQADHVTDWQRHKTWLTLFAFTPELGDALHEEIKRTDPEFPRERMMQVTDPVRPLIHDMWHEHMKHCMCIDAKDIEAWQRAPMTLDAEAFLVRKSRVVTCDKCIQGTLRCARCQRKTYCGAECQRSDWWRHKAACDDASLGNPRMPADLRDLGLPAQPPTQYVRQCATVGREWLGPDMLRRDRCMLYRQFLRGKTPVIQRLLLRYDCFGFYADKEDGKPLRLTGLTEGNDGELYLEATTASVLTLPSRVGDRKGRNGRNEGKTGDDVEAEASATESHEPHKVHSGRNMPLHQVVCVTEWTPAQLELIAQSPCPEAWLLPQGFAAFLDKD